MTNTCPYCASTFEYSQHKHETKKKSCMEAGDKVRLEEEKQLYFKLKEKYDKLEEKVNPVSVSYVEVSYKDPEPINNKIFLCDHCQGMFVNQSALDIHCKSNKKCNRNKQEDQGIIFRKGFICLYCSKNFTSKNRLLTHFKCCFEIKEEEIKEELLD